MATKKDTKTTAKPSKATKAEKNQSAKTTPKQTKTEAGTKKMSALEAAARVLAEVGVALTCREIVEQMAAKKYWRSPSGATPWSTIAAAIAREIKVKGAESRFTKTERGKFSRA
jgi:hypothetical protein